MDLVYYFSSIDSSYVKFYCSQGMNIIGVVSALAGAALVQVSLYLLIVPFSMESWKFVNCLFNVNR